MRAALEWVRSRAAAYWRRSSMPSAATRTTAATAMEAAIRPPVCSAATLRRRRRLRQRAVIDAAYEREWAAGARFSVSASQRRIDDTTRNLVRFDAAAGRWGAAAGKRRRRDDAHAAARNACPGAEARTARRRRAQLVARGCGAGPGQPARPAGAAVRQPSRRLAARPVLGRRQLRAPPGRPCPRVDEPDGLSACAARPRRRCGLEAARGIGTACRP